MRIAKVLFLILIVFCYSEFAIGQSRCGTKMVEGKFKEHAPGGNIFEQSLTSIQNGRAATDDSTVYIIPVVVHIVYNSGDSVIGTGFNIPDSRATSQIEILNQDYRRMAGTLGYNTSPVGADAKIEFRLANRDPQGNVTSGIVRVQGPQTDYVIGSNNLLKDLSRWPTDRYLNIWVCNLTDLLGYAQFPLSDLEGIPNDVMDSLYDGIVIRSNAFGLSGIDNEPYNFGRTATHEIGHYLGLLHVWGDSFDCATSTDYCDDTPTQSGPVNNCPTRRASCIAGVSAMIPNYMNYTDDQCMNIFTVNQVSRMRYVVSHSLRRRTLFNSGGYVLDSAIPKHGEQWVFMPIPAKNDLIIQTTEQISSASLVNVIGQDIPLNTLEDGLGKYHFDITFVKSGWYLFKAQTKDGVFTRRLVVNND
jgi:hypothetical protein